MIGVTKWLVKFHFQFEVHTRRHCWGICVRTGYDKNISLNNILFSFFTDISIYIRTKLTDWKTSCLTTVDRTLVSKQSFEELKGMLFIYFYSDSFNVIDSKVNNEGKSCCSINTDK